MSLVAPTVTGYSAFWSAILSGGNGGPYSMSLAQSRAGSAYRIARAMKKGETRDAIGALAELIGATAGGTALNQYKRRTAQVGPDSAVPGVTSVASMGGAIAIETVDAINRATTAADVAELKKWFNNALLESGITYPTVVGPNISQGTQLNGVTRF